MLRIWTRWRKHGRAPVSVPEPKPEPSEHPEMVEFEAASAAAASLRTGKGEMEWKVGDGRMATTERR